MIRLTLLIALRNLLAHKTKSLIVGSIILFGTATVVIGSALLDSVDAAMSRTITSSIAGHLQVYSNTGRDKLALFGSGFAGGDDIGHMRNFGEVRQLVEALPNVKAVVPMGLQATTAMTGNSIDAVLAELRRAVSASPADSEAVDEAAGAVRGLAGDLHAEVSKRLLIAENKDELKQQLEDIATIQQDAFWQRLHSEPTETLTFLDTRIAPLAADGRQLWLRNLGTDLQRFTRLFDRFEIVQGTAVPEGKRGFLFADRVYEKRVKHRVARELDRLKDGRERLGAFSLDTKLAARARRLPRQYSRIAYQLSPSRAQAVQQSLASFLKLTDQDMNTLLRGLLAVTDDNFDAHYSFFYDEIAPHIRLYDVPIGGEVTLRALTKAGYFKAINVPVYGTYRFKGLEKSDLAGAQNLVDMVTFRELYGVMTQEARRELASIRAEVGVTHIDRDDAEASLFGGTADANTIDTIAPEDAAAAFIDDIVKFDDIDARLAKISQQEIDDGLAVNAAVVLHDASKLTETLGEIEQLFKAERLDLKVVTWRDASGMIGQFILVLRAVLYIAIFIIFAVALVIINNSMVMATMERVAEIGTMRAIGAQRSLIMSSFLLESALLGALAGAAGLCTALTVLLYFQGAGIPATSDIMVFLFSGPRLFPTATPGAFLLGFVVVFIVTLVSSLYPALIATGIQPVVAMQTKE